MNFTDYLRAKYPLLADKDLSLIHWDLAKLAAEAEAWHAGEVLKISVSEPTPYVYETRTDKE